MKLSEKIKEIQNSGDVGEALDGLHEEAEKLEGLLQLCVKDLYSLSRQLKKSTARKLFAYVNKYDINID